MIVRQKISFVKDEHHFSSSRERRLSSYFCGKRQAPFSKLTQARAIPSCYLPGEVNFVLPGTIAACCYDPIRESYVG